MATPVDQVEKIVKRGRRTGTLNKKTLQKMLALEQVRAMVAFDIMPMVQAQIDKAKEGDTVAFQALMDRAYGKAVQGIGFVDDKGKVLPQPIMNIMLGAPEPTPPAVSVPSTVIHDAPVLSEASSVESVKE